MQYKLTMTAALLVAIWFCFQASPARGDTREYMVGDIDGFSYDGPGSADDVYVDPDWLAYAEITGAENGVQDFDQLMGNHRLPFTFLFPLDEGEEVVAATLTLAFRKTASQTETDGITFNHLLAPRWFHFNDLGWLPIAETGTSLRSLDLSNSLGVDVLYLLQEGELDVLVEDDTAIDYAVLTLEVIPEPATLSLLALGGLAVLRRKSP